MNNYFFGNKIFIYLVFNLVSVFSLAALDLTVDEKLWLNSHKTIRYAPAPNYPPIEFFDDNGNFSGITSDFLKILRERYHINFTIVKYNTWADVVFDTKQRKVDVWGCAAKNEERLLYMSFPDPYIFFPSVIIVNDNDQKNYTIDQLSDKKVVVVNNYATHKFVTKNYPGYELVIVSDIETGLRIISIGSADAMIVTNAAASYYTEKTGINNLRVAGVLNEEDLDLNLGFAVRSDWPELSSILQKALDSISETEKKDIFRQWINLEASHRPLTKTQIITIGIICFFILFQIVFFWNLTLRKQVTTKTRELETANRELSLIFQNTPVGIIYVVDRIVRRCNPAVLQMTGYTLDEIIGEKAGKFFLTQKDNNTIENMYSKELREGETVRIEIEIRTKSNKLIWCDLIGQAENREDPPKGTIWIASDISVQKKLEESLIRQAQTDSLTGILNRRYFEERAGIELNRCFRNNRPVSFLMLDIDHFKQVNDTYGHEAGDKVLMFFCKIINSLVRVYDVFGRIGGEEFGLFMPETDSVISYKISERIRKAIEANSLSFEGKEIKFTVSIGLTGFKSDGNEIKLSELIRQGDKALYWAKNDGRNQVKIYD